MFNKLGLLTTLLMIMIPVVTLPAVIHVPADYATIQQAINAAVDGDNVVVAPGTYMENIDFLGKDLVLESSGGPAVTTIDGGGMESVASFVHGEGRATVIRGFTITNGGGTRIPATSSSHGGGGIFCSNNSAPLITGNIITGHHHPYITSSGRESVL